MFVLHYAMSGGTLVALTADEIAMDDNAVLGPVDPQLGQQPAASILTVLDRKNINEVDDQTIILADIATKAISQIKAPVTGLLRERLGEEQAVEAATLLSTGTWTHDYPISVSEARAMGLPIRTEMPRTVYDLMALYPQTAQRRPSVEYIPMPYGPREPDRPRSSRRE